MTGHDSPQFLAVLTLVAEMFERDLSDAMQALYFEALRDLSLEDCLRGLTQAARQCTFMPRPAEIRAFVVPDEASAAEAAWLEFKRLARAVGAYASPTISDGVLADTLVAIFGSWPQACWTDLTPEMWAAKRKEFDRVYRVMQQRGSRESQRLPGFCELENAARGLVTAMEARPQ